MKIKKRYLAAAGLFAMLCTGCGANTEESETSGSQETVLRSHANAVVVDTTETVVTTVSSESEDVGLGVTAPPETVSVSEFTTTLESVAPEEVITENLYVPSETTFIDKAIEQCLADKSIFNDESGIMAMDINLDGYPELVVHDYSVVSREIDGLLLYTAYVYDFKDMSCVTTFEDGMYTSIKKYVYPDETHWGICCGELNYVYKDNNWQSIGSYALKQGTLDDYTYYLEGVTAPVSYDEWLEAVNVYLNWEYVEPDFNLKKVGTLSKDSSDEEVTSVVREALMQWCLRYDVPSVDYFD